MHGHTLEWENRKPVNRVVDFAASLDHGGAVVGGIAGHCPVQPVRNGELKERGKFLASHPSAALMLLGDCRSEQAFDSALGYHGHGTKWTMTARLPVRFPGSLAHGTASRGVQAR